MHAFETKPNIHVKATETRAAAEGLAAEATSKREIEDCQVA